jgi:hypothetical protein
MLSSEGYLKTAEQKTRALLDYEIAQLKHENKRFEGPSET